MRYLMKQKWLAFGDDYWIETEAGQRAFFVDGRVFSIGDKLSILDLRGNEVAFIAQKLLALGRTYQIWRADRLAAVVHKQLFTFFHCTFTVDVPGPDDLVAQGDFLDHEYTVAHHSGRPAASISKKWLRLTDTYTIDVAPDEDDVLILACVVAIDLCCHANRDD